ncbi:trypsin-like peptidase domain-containing protein [Stieleria varia]|uniref:Putative periplasmic serine endoprotease DegP-like n=1 Tax=Stieleria varia TaxID=2528005 RepID=A0A5C5ZWD9_9BACT|nr:trypsin-like peptidase domain-containing protein [Stieleria varia]TWT91579.1 putative periplasmic serine endoprotease DegP-like precursor [Stieleria varia]
MMMIFKALSPGRKHVKHSIVAALLVTLVGWSGNVVAQDDMVPDWMRRNLRANLTTSRDSGAMMNLVQPFSKQVSDSVVQVFCGRRSVALGVVVAVDGYLITKRSELTGEPISVRFSDGRKVSAEVAGVRRSSDLALLKVDDSRELTPIEFSEESPLVGSFLISPGRAGRLIGLGVVGVQSRRIEHQGRLGVRLDENDSGPALVRMVYPESGAEHAGVQERDRILAVNGQQAVGRHGVIQALRQIYPGEVVALTIQRGDQTLDLDAVISDIGLLQESENDSKVNGPRSMRLSGFDQVIQHDTVLAPEQCGGPVLDSSGNVVGINIARAGRVVSYSLPASLVVPQVLSLLEEARHAR